MFNICCNGESSGVEYFFLHFYVNWKIKALITTIQLCNINLINYMQSIINIWSYVLIYELND